MIDLMRPEAWAQTELAGGSEPVQIVRLIADRLTGASLSLVRFPVGWERLTDGHFDSDEEILLLEGELLMTGRRYRAGQYGWVPRGSLRRATATPNGCLALAWYSGTPKWTESFDDEPDGERFQMELASIGLDTPTPFGVNGVRLRATENGEAWLLGSVPPGTVTHKPADMVALGVSKWVRVDADTPLPPFGGRSLVRTWG